MLNTAEDIFKMFLDGIKKTSTKTVLPDKFVRIYNEWGMNDFLKTHGLLDRRVNQDPITRDKFRNLILMYFYRPMTLNLIEYPYIFEIPNNVKFGYPYQKSMKSSGFSLPDPEIMPKYLRFMSARFKLNYDSNANQICGLTGYSDWLTADEIMSMEDEKVFDMYYFSPSDDRRYFKVFDNYIEFFNGNQSKPLYILLEYVKYPNEMSYDENNGAWEYTIDLTVEQIQSVVDSCVRLYLERVGSERYKSFFSEDRLRS